MKNKQLQYQALSQQAEYSIIRKDLIKVLVLNAVYLAVILSLYFADQRTHFLTNWLIKKFHL